MRVRVKSRRTKQYILGAAGSLVLLLAVIPSFFAFVPAVNAVSSNDRIGPNPSWYKNNARIVLENDANVQGANNTVIPLYVLNTEPTADPSSKPPDNVSVRAYSFTKGYAGGTASPIRLSYCSGNTGYISSDKTFTVSKNCFTYDSDINGWRANITGNLQHNGLMHFRLRINSPNTGNELFGYATQSSSRAFAMANEYRCDYGGQTTGCGRFYNFTIPFGTPCSVSSNQGVRAGIFDGDNSTSSSPYTIQYNRKFSVQIFDVTENRVIGHSFSGGEGNNQQAWYNFTVKPSHKYQFRVNNVYTNNALQFSLPFDSINSITDCSWDLEPVVSLNTETVESNTANLTANPSVDNVGKSISDSVQWQLTRCRVDPGGNPASYGSVSDNTSNGVDTYNALGASCGQVSSGSRTFPRSLTNLSPLTNQAIGDEPVGTRICFILSVRPPTSDSNSNVWRHSTPACAVVAKKPKVVITGNDLFVGKGNDAVAQIITSISRKDVSGTDRTYGSWGEYAIAATGEITGAASGGGYSGGNTSAEFCNASVLTFTNAGVSVCTSGTLKGGYTTGSLPDPTAWLTATSSLGANQTVNVASMANGSYTGTGTITVNASGNIGKGRWVVINAPNANVRITGNLSYTNEPLQTIFDIPQVVIIADTISIDASVSRVDAWLVALGNTGSINTCREISNPAQSGNELTAGRCNNTLTVNGPVLAKTLSLYRTAGSGTGTSSGDPAEVFNLRPDAYLWATARSAESGRLPTASTTELPPRF